MMRLKRRNSRWIRIACAVFETVAQHLFRLPPPTTVACGHPIARPPAGVAAQNETERKARDPHVRLL